MTLRTRTQKNHLNRHVLDFWVYEAKLNRQRLGKVLRVSEFELKRLLSRPDEYIKPRQVLILSALLGKPLNVMLGVIYAGLNSVDAVAYMKGEALPDVPKFDISEEKPFGQ